MSLAGTDGNRAFRACPLIWRMFSAMAEKLTDAAERHQDEQARKEMGQEEKGKKQKDGSDQITNVSAFLSRRTVDPDGHPRRAGGITPRSLAEIVGNDLIFAELHRQFSVLLQKLGELVGGLPLNETLVCQSILQENSNLRPKSGPGSTHHPGEIETSMAKVSLNHTHATSKGKHAFVQRPISRSQQQVVG